MVLDYIRETYGGERAAVLLNFSDAEQTVEGMEEYRHYAVLVSNQSERGVVEGRVVLRPFGAVVLYTSSR
jgi:hypothetical protein